MNRKKRNKGSSESDSHSVVQFEENGKKLFECIWDGWFVDENRTSCYWPPKGKSYLLRVLSKEKPEDSWKICQCVVVSEGHVTYKSGFEIVKEKCAQTCNTSSADEQQQLKKYRRKHPVLAAQTESFEYLFAKDSEGASKKPKKSTLVPKERAKKSKTLQNETLRETDFRADPKSSNQFETEHCAGTPSQDSYQRSSSRSSNESLLSCVIQTGTSSDLVVSVSPRQVSTRRDFKSSISDLRSIATNGSRSRSSGRSVHSRSRSRSRSPSRSRSRSRSRSHSRSRSWTPNSQRSRCSKNSAKDSVYHRHEFRHSKSRSRSRSTTGFRSNNSDRHSSSRDIGVDRESSAATNRSMELQLKQLTIIAKQNYQRTAAMESRQIKMDRRQARMEVTVNKVLVTVTDLKQAIINVKNKSSGGPSSSTPMASNNEIPKGFKAPDFPISTLPQLMTLNRNLRDGEFRVFLLTQEAYYCSASRQSDSVVMIAYLKRFLTLELRDTVHLKDPKGKDDEPTLVRDFPEVYKFLIDVMIKGYSMSNAQIKSSEVHVAIRTVWGRTKQMLREQR